MWSILEGAEAENRAKDERASWDENPFYNKNYRCLTKITDTKLLD
jgi:hypothetical protein